MQLPLKGIIPPLVTPLLENGELDLPGLKNLVHYVLAGGVHGLFLLGTTGEGTSLSHNLRKQLVTETCAIVLKKVPVLVGITDTSMQESLELAQHSASAGADFLVLAAPYYLPISQGELQDYLRILLPLLPLPFLMYNMPSCTKMELSLETVALTRKMGAVGIKDSSGNKAFTNQLINAFAGDPLFSIITGTEAFLHDTLFNGGHGAVAGGANFFPRLFVDLYYASINGDSAKIALLSETVWHIENTIYAVGENTSKYIKGTKGALAALGICQDFTAPPITRFNENDRELIQKHITWFLSRNEFAYLK